MTRRRRSRARPWAAVAAALLSVSTATAGRPRAADPAADGVRVDLVDGSVVMGGVVSIGSEELRIDTGDGERRLPLGDVRRLTRTGHSPAAAERRMRMDAVDGTWIEGDDFLWQGETATVVRGDATISVPISQVKRVVWRDPTAAAWLAALPADPVEDLVVVTSDDASEVVDCAIIAVSPEAVSVVLDGETIPVRRAKVLGLVWARPGAAESGVRIAIDGGRLAGRVVGIEGGDLVVDGVTRVPLAVVESIDFAAARSVALCDLEPERCSTEPFVGDLAAIAGVAAFFAPRVTTAAAGTDPSSASGTRALVVRPRTVAVWRVPEAARTFRARVARGSGSRPGAAVRVTVRLDDRTAWEGVLDAKQPMAADVELDVGGAGRFELLVDFVEADPGCPVTIERGVFER